MNPPGGRPLGEPTEQIRVYAADIPRIKGHIGLKTGTIGKPIKESAADVIRRALDAMERSGTMKKADLKPGMKLVHKARGECFYSEQCAFLESRNPDTTSTFVEFDGEIAEITLGLLRIAE